MTAPTRTPSMYDDPNRPCLGKGEVFFSPDWLKNRRGGWNPMPAKLICYRCDHRDECAEVALNAKNPLHYGVWGGLDEEQRRGIMKCRRGDCEPGCRHLNRQRKVA